MSTQDKAEHVIAPAVVGCPALAELSEFSRRAPHLDFAQAKRQAILNALKRAIALPGNASRTIRGTDFDLL